MDLTCFKAYDIRGRIPDELNEAIAYRIGRAYAEFLRPRNVVVGRDVRLTSEALCRSLSEGLMDGGSDVSDIGLCGTEEVYFATFHEKMAGGIMVTASHNPMDYNGLKLVRKDSRPISGDTGLHEIRDLAGSADFPPVERRGGISSLNIKDKYIEHLLGYIDAGSLKPLKIVVNAGNGCAGPVLDLLERRLPFELVKVHHRPDGTFPNGIPNPLLTENRAATADAVRENGADVGIAWDGDFDRCFFFDEKGQFVEGYYLVGLLAESLLQKQAGAKIIHDPRLTWNTVDIVDAAGGVPVLSKTGHAFIKERMRAEDAIYGGEMSAHHYFKGFAYCDSGMIPWLLVLELMSQKNTSLSELVCKRLRRFPSSGEINRKLQNPQKALKDIEERYTPAAIHIDRTDGLSMEFERFRFNLRSSNTEPLLRLNVESKNDELLMKEKTVEILSVIDETD